MTFRTTVRKHSTMTPTVTFAQIPVPAQSQAPTSDPTPTSAPCPTPTQAPAAPDRHHRFGPLGALWASVNDFIFPSICYCCGDAMADRDRYLCDLCLFTRFDDAKQTDPILLPECVRSSFSMWSFDKTEVLQDLLHMLKYKNIPQAGVELGRELGRAWIASGNSTPEIIRSAKAGEEWAKKQCDLIRLVPVPLHRSKFRRRGYNQAEKIALGVSAQTGIRVIAESAIRKTRKTISQTGLRIVEREKNVKGSFLVDEPDEIRHRRAVIVDDVFTTGATTFELAGVLEQAGAEEVHIITVALA